MFIAALFIIARTQKQPRCPSADKWIKKMWYVYAMEYFSIIKRNKLESFVVRWMNLQPVMQSEVSQKKKNVSRHICMEFRKMVMMTLYARQQKKIQM